MTFGMNEHNQFVPNPKRQRMLDSKSPEIMVEEDLERDEEDQEYMSDVVI
jgi:hypothetical protein